jgi:hypothetical protein
VEDADVLTLTLLPAAHGDALVVTFGPGDGGGSPVEGHRRLLVDGGPAHTYAGALGRYLRELPAEGRRFELFVVSHIDADHIDGAIIALQDAPALDVRFKDVWFNGWPQLEPLRGPEQGGFLDALLDAEQPGAVPRNRTYDGSPVRRGVDQHVDVAGGCRLTVLSPDQAQLMKLRANWERAAARGGFGQASAADVRARLAERRMYQPPPSEPDETADATDRGGSRVGGDRAVANGSSIALLVEHGGRTLLLGADAHASVLADGLRALRDRRQIERVPLDVVKLSHHGSIGNITPELLSLIDCRRFVVSTNGDRFHHPDPETIELIGATVPGAEVYFNYLSETTERWADPAEQARSGIRAHFGEAGCLEIEV